jgi:hypothetical protein
MDDTGFQPANTEEIAHRTSLPRRVVLVLAYLDARALGISLGIICGIWLFLITAIALWREDVRVLQSLALLSQFFPGFWVSYARILLDVAYACFSGFVIGYLFASIRNYLVHSYIRFLRRRGEQEAASELLDHLM